MFNIGETLIYANTGLCSVEDVREESFAGENKRYYILKPLSDTKSTIHIPCDSERLTKKMHKLLSEKEALLILSHFSDSLIEWQEHDKRRAEAFRKVIESADRRLTASLINTIRKKRLEFFKKGKKLRASDEVILKSAESLFFEEFCYVLKKDKNELELLLK